MIEITVRELRALLFEVADQETTVGQLRAWLFQEDDQDERVSKSLLHSMTREG